MYGMESAHFRKPENKIDKFQRRGIRQILQLKSTDFERENKNESIIKKANE